MPQAQVKGAMAQTISANNVLAHPDELSPPPQLRTSRPGASIQDRLAANIGLLRTMFKENAQKPFCPFIDDIGPQIVKAFNLTSKNEVAQVYELLVMSQRASGHPIAEFDIFSKLLREHSKKKESGQKKALVKKQQDLALRGMKNATGPSSASARGTITTPREQRNNNENTTTNTGSSSKANQQQQQQQQQTMTATAARTVADWVQFLNQFSSKNDQRLNWVEFAGAIHNLPATWRRGATLEPNDMWSARSFFMSCASVENLLVGPDARVTTKSLASYFTSGRVIARTAKTVANGSTIRDSMYWNDGSGLAPETAFIGEAALKEKQGPSAAQDTVASHQTRALRLRNGGSKKWAVAHIPVQNEGNSAEVSTTKLPKIKSARG